MAICYICENEITKENKYKEHIILNAIGGKLKSGDLICSNCSRHFDSIDAELAKQLNLITCHLNVKRDRGNKKIPSTKATIIATGEEIYIEPGGKPVYKPKPPQKHKNGYSFQARNLSELRKQMIGVARNEPRLNNVDKLMKEVKQGIKKGEIPDKKYIDSRVNQNLSLDGNDFLRSICKMAINFYMYKKGEREYIKHLIPYIRGATQTQIVCYWYYPESNIFPDLIEEDKVIHALTVHGNPREKILYSIIKLYGAFQFIILLNDNYEGNEINDSYLFDVINRENISDDYSINNILTKAELQKTLKEHLVPESRYLEKVNKLFDFICKKQLCDYSKQIVKDILSRFPEGEVMTEENYREFCYGLYSNIIETLII